MKSIHHIPPHEFWYQTPAGWASEQGARPAAAKNLSFPITSRISANSGRPLRSPATVRNASGLAG